MPQKEKAQKAVKGIQNTLDDFNKIVQEMSTKYTLKMSKSRAFMAELDKLYPLTKEAQELIELVQIHQQMIIKGNMTTGYAQEEFKEVQFDARHTRQILNSVAAILAAKGL